MTLHHLITTVPRRAMLAGAGGVLLALGLGLLASCADGGSGGSGGSGESVPPASPTGESPGSVPPAPLPDEETPDEPAPATVTPVAGERARVVPWRVVRAAGTALVVEVQVGGRPCDAVTDVEVDESSERVRLTVWAGPVAGAECTGQPALLGTARVRVRLAEPVGERDVIQG